MQIEPRGNRSRSRIFSCGWMMMVVALVLVLVLSVL
jgi:hypothetical protein